MYLKDKIIEYNELKYSKFSDYNIAFLSGDIFEGEEVEFELFEEDTTTEVSYEDDYFYQLNINRFDNKLLFEFIKLGEENGFYKQWAYFTFMSELKSVCDEVDYVYVNNYDVSEDDPLFRAFFLSMMIDIEDFDTFNSAYRDCAKLCETLIDIAEKRLKGIWWNKDFESNEMLFCDLFLTPYFNTLGFDDVIFNHGPKEFGKDYLLVTSNLFNEREYYGVQAKAGNLSGSATGNINEIISQINLAFDVPYKLINGTDVYTSKVIIAISGKFTENAKEIIKNRISRYKFSNLIFLDKSILSTKNFSI